MNRGTQIRTVFYVVAMLNQANVSLGIKSFGNEKIDLAYKVFSYILSLIATAIALWFNNDFTPEGEAGTTLTREMKANKNQSWDYVEEPEDSEVTDYEE